jgi:hypothetical protein
MIKAANEMKNLHKTWETAKFDVVADFLGMWFGMREGGIFEKGWVELGSFVVNFSKKLCGMKSKFS